MILKGFKEKSNKKYLNKLLSEKHENVSNNKIESLGVILNLDEFDAVSRFQEFTNLLNIHPNKFKIITFSKIKNERHNSWDLCFNPGDFGWNGVLKNIELETFLNTKFDALISYFEHDVLELKLLSTLSKSAFKIGVYKEDERLNDLIIKTSTKDFDVFKNELFKYLTILNKIKNE